MNREILFRGKRKDNGKWIEGGYVEHDGKVFIVIWTRYSPDTRDWDTAEYYENNPHYTSCLIEVIPETVCQYTGLTDRNGRKIFEGDIVDSDGAIGVVKHGKYKNGFHYGYYIEWYKCPNLRHELGYWNTISQVIGNIFDNPELIGE